MGSSFVFHDPSGRRWARFRRILRTGGIFGSLAVVLFLVSVFSNPQLPALGLPPVEHVVSTAEIRGIIRGEKALRNVPFKLRKAARNIQYVRGSTPVIHPRKAARSGPTNPIVFGFYVNWDPASIVSLRLNLHHLTHLLPEWLILNNAAGDLNDETDAVVLQIAKEANLPVLPMVTNYRAGWRAQDLHAVLTNPHARADLVQNIFSNLQEHGFSGVNIDLEQLAVRDREALVAFMGELRARLKPAGYVISQSVPVDDEAYDLKRLGELADYIVPMVYDEHYQSGTPGPVASEEWFESQLEKLARAVPPSKVVAGIGSYGYDWTLGGRGAVEVSFDDVMSAAAKGARVEWNADLENPVLRYQAAGQQHEVWFLDAVTALNEVEDVRDNGFRGYAVWRLGAEDPGVWTVFQPETWPADPFDPAALYHLTAQRSVKHYGEGEIIRIGATPRDGSRNVWRQQDGDYAEQYRNYPSYYVIESIAPPPPRTVAVTFDDGPDPKFTPAILDILKAKHVPAAFFVVGVNAEQAPGLVRRMYVEGHEIGNHSYSHPNIATVSAERTRLELAATQRIIEHATGRSSILFRPPYNADSEPQTPDEIVPVLRAQGFGYLTVAERIDPRDWQAGATADQIVADIVDQEKDGQIILLHDGGGDRTQTILALPRIIDHFQQHGYRFASVGELLGKTRDQVMPVPSADEMRWANIEGQGFDTEGAFKKTIGMLFLWAIYLTLARTLIYGVLALIQKQRAARRQFDPSFAPAVSVVMAAYNEDKVIERTVRSLLDDAYPALEVVVVDDGSSDATLAVLRGTFGSEPRVRILSQPNRGKATALNHAISQASHEILVALDADTIFRQGTIAALARHFCDPKVGAVSGNARVGNRHNWITRFQSIEYIFGFNLDRRALDVLNAITVVPGAVGAWRKSLIRQLGGFQEDTLAEDTDLTLAIRRLGYSIRYEEQAVAYTEAPEDGRSLARQRFRWAFGTLQAVWKHRDATFDPRYGSLGWVALPSIWLFQILLSVLAPFAEVAMILALFAGNWLVVLAYYMGFFVLEFLTGVLAYRLDGSPMHDLRLLFLQRLYYRQLMHYILGKSMLFALQGRLVGWGKLERRATVQQV